MKSKRNNFLIKFLFLLVMVSLSIPGQWLIGNVMTDQPVLARVEVTGMLNDLELPVYAHMQDATGKDYALVIAPQAQLEQSGAVYTILDKDTTGADYFILSLDNRMPVARFENTLLDDGKQIIIRSTFKQTETLAEAGLDVRWLEHTPMVLSVPKQQEEATVQTVTYDSVIAQMMGQVTQSTVETYTKNLSGVNAVTIGGSSYTIATRNTSSGTPISKATQYVYEFMQAQGLTASYHNWSLGGYSGRNVIGQKTGTTTPNEIVLITAHLDDMPTGSTAPGADDNASGSVGVMLCAELLSDQQFARTIRFCLFTGEEQGIYGSAAYSDLVYGNGENIVAVYNMDMISYDGSGLPYLRLHTRTSSNPGYSGDLAIANTFVDVVNAYSLSSNLSPIITSDGETRSDHSSFWSNGYYAILGIEDHINDITPYYHLTSDTVTTLNWTYFTNYVKASVGTAAHLAIRDDGTPDPPVAAFTGNPTTVNVGGTVAFTDQSTNIPTSWSWSFPGGTPATSTAQNPSVVYNTVGTYNVTLTAANAYGNNTLTKTNYIIVTNAANEIAEAVDYSATFTLSGSANWTRVTDVYYNGGDSAKSGTITHSQSTSIETSVTVTAAKSVKFYWKVSSESGYDYLRFYIDGVQKNQVSGTVDWTQVSNSIAAGTHTLKWTYLKDTSVSSGSDCGWVDKLEIVDGSVTYCTSSGTSQADEWIGRVRIGTLDKSSGASPYSDYTSTITNYTRGASQSVTLTPAFSGSAYTEYWVVWIDYNKNGVFTDSGESVFSKSGSAAVTGSFTVSSSASTGNTRMRVSMKYGSAPSSCGTFSYGEVEDYTANIL